jgi:hypothetical protein
MPWWYLALLVAAIVIGVALAPKPQSQPPAGFGDIQAPTAEEGREIPVLFGTRTLEGPNVVWYGDFDTVAVQSRGGKK